LLRSGAHTKIAPGTLLNDDGGSPMRARSTLFALSVLVALLALTRPADARDVYLNGVKLDSSVVIQPQTFANCDVRIDAKGAIHITARGYKVVPTEAPAAATPRPPAGAPRKFWLISKQTERGIVQYDVDVFVNEQFVAKVKSIEEPVVLDISRFVSDGENRVRMIAVKNIGERRSSQSPTDTLEVIIGEGVAGGGTVTVDKVHVNFKRHAGETSNLREDFSFQATSPR
jgi:hypothetical protein